MGGGNESRIYDCDDLGMVYCLKRAAGWHTAHLRSFNFHDQRRHLLGDTVEFDWRTSLPLSHLSREIKVLFWQKLDSLEVPIACQTLLMLVFDNK